MRVFIAASNLGEWGETDGVVTFYRSLIPLFAAEKRCEVDLAAYGPCDRIQEFGNLRVIIHKPRLPVKVDPCRWIDPAIRWSFTGRMLLREKYDLVQSSTPCPMGRFARTLARKNRAPFVALYHTALDQYAEIRFRKMLGRRAGQAAGLIMSQVIRRYYESADLILAPSYHVKRRIEEICRPPVRILSRGVNTRCFHPGRRTRSGGKVRALYVGRVALEKNLSLLVDLFQNRTDLELMVVGDGPYLDEMKKLLPSAIFTGCLSGEALYRAYADGDLFVFPSLTDTLGNVVLEAMSSGLPVIVTDSMGPQELVQEGSTGFVVSGKPEFEAALDRLALNEKLRGQMGAKARKYAESRSWGGIFHELMTTYHRILGGGVKRGAVRAEPSHRFKLEGM